MMLIGYARPSGVTWSIGSDGSGQAWVTDTSALDDGRPARATRFSWRTDAAVPGQVVTLSGDWASTMPIRVVALLGLVGIPAGTPIELRGDVHGVEVDLGIPAQVAMALPDRSIASWFVIPAMVPPLTGVRIRLSNTADGQVVVPAGAFVDVGEIAIFAAVDVPISSGWTSGLVDGTVRTRTLGAQLNEIPRRSYRQLQTPIAAARRASVRGRELGNGMDWEHLQAAILLAGARCVVVPRWGKDGQIDLQELHRTAIFGKASVPGATGHQGGDWYAASWTFEEIPPG